MWEKGKHHVNSDGFATIHLGLYVITRSTYGTYGTYGILVAGTYGTSKSMSQRYVK